MAAAAKSERSPLLGLGSSGEPHDGPAPAMHDGVFGTPEDTPLGTAPRLWDKRFWHLVAIGALCIVTIGLRINTAKMATVYDPATGKASEEVVFPKPLFLATTYFLGKLIILPFVQWQPAQWPSRTYYLITVMVILGAIGGGPGVCVGAVLAGFSGGHGACRWPGLLHRLRISIHNAEKPYDVANRQCFDHSRSRRVCNLSVPCVGFQLRLRRTDGGLAGPSLDILGRAGAGRVRGHLAGGIGRRGCLHLFRRMRPDRQRGHGLGAVRGANRAGARQRCNGRLHRHVSITLLQSRAFRAHHRHCRPLSGRDDLGSSPGKVLRRHHQGGSAVLPHRCSMVVCGYHLLRIPGLRVRGGRDGGWSHVQGLGRRPHHRRRPLLCARATGSGGGGRKGRKGGALNERPVPV